MQVSESEILQALVVWSRKCSDGLDLLSVVLFSSTNKKCRQLIPDLFDLKGTLWLCVALGVHQLIVDAGYDKWIEYFDMDKNVGKYRVYIQKAIEQHHWTVILKMFTTESWYWYKCRGHIDEGLSKAIICNWDHMPIDLKQRFYEARDYHTFGTAPFNVTALSLGREDLIRGNEKQTLHAKWMGSLLEKIIIGGPSNLIAWCLTRITSYFVLVGYEPLWMLNMCYMLSEVFKHLLISDEWQIHFEKFLEIIMNRESCQGILRPIESGYIFARIPTTLEASFIIACLSLNHMKALHYLFTNQRSVALDGFYKFMGLTFLDSNDQRNLLKYSFIEANHHRYMDDSMINYLKDHHELDLLDLCPITSSIEILHDFLIHKNWYLAKKYSEISQTRPDLEDILSTQNIDYINWANLETALFITDENVKMIIHPNEQVYHDAYVIYDAYKHHDISLQISNVPTRYLWLLENGVQPIKIMIIAVEEKMTSMVHHAWLSRNCDDSLFNKIATDYLIECTRNKKFYKSNDRTHVKAFLDDFVAQMQINTCELKLLHWRRNILIRE